MVPIQIEPISKPVNIHVGGSKIVLPKVLRQKVDQHWQQLIKDNPRLHNGEAFTVTRVDETADAVDIELAETDYAHYLYSRQIDGLGEFTVRIIHSATLVITADDKLVFGVMGKHTSLAGVIQCCGGGIDYDDITDGVVDIEHNTVKELAEELGLNPYDKAVADDFYPAYLKTGGPTEKMTLAYILRIKLTGEQFLSHYDKFAKKIKDSKQEPEFGQIFCIDANRKSIEAFISENEGKFNEYMPVLLRAAITTSRDSA